MSRKRRQYSPQFKAKIAIAAMQGVKTLPELASEHDLHPTMINTWKRKLLEGASDLFDKGKAAKQASSDTQSEIAELYRRLGSKSGYTFAALR